MLPLLFCNSEGYEATAPGLLCPMHPAGFGYQCNDGASEAWFDP